MTYHIHPSPEPIHPSPKPITPFSLYTTEKPDEEHNDWYIAMWWHDSHLAYLQEPEWKVFDKPYRISDGEDTGHINTEESLQAVKDSNEFSHHYPGQKIDPSKVSYVRRSGLNEDEENERQHLTDLQKRNDYPFAEIVKPIKLLLGLIEGQDPHKPQTKWQPSPEPAKYIVTKENKISQKTAEEMGDPFMEGKEDEPDYEHNPLHAQWTTDRSLGKVQATVKLNI